MAEGFDSLSKRSLHVHIYGVPSQLTLFWEEFSAFEQVYVILPLLWMFVLLLDACMRITAIVIVLALPYIATTSVHQEERVAQAITIWGFLPYDNLVY